MPEMESNGGTVPCRLPVQLVVIQSFRKIEDHFVDIFETVEHVVERIGGHGSILVGGLDTGFTDSTTEFLCIQPAFYFATILLNGRRLFAAFLHTEGTARCEAAAFRRI